MYSSSAKASAATSKFPSTTSQSKPVPSVPTCSVRDHVSNSLRALNKSWTRSPWTSSNNQHKSSCKASSATPASGTSERPSSPKHQQPHADSNAHQKNSPTTSEKNGAKAKNSLSASNTRAATATP